MSTSMIPNGSPELTRESPELTRESQIRVDEPNTTFGFDTEELLKRLMTDSDFKSKFMSEYSVLVQIVQKYKDSEKEKLKDAKAVAKSEKDHAVREHLKTVISKILEKEPNLVLEPESVHGNFFEDSSINYIKEWLKNYRIAKKTEKETIRQAKADAKAEKEAMKHAKADAKAAKEEVLREKLISQLPKLLEKVETLEIEYDEDTLTLPELKNLHTRVKMLGQLKQYSENVNEIPDVEADDYDCIKTIHVRAKIINQYNRLCSDDELSYHCDETNDEVKVLIKKAKEADHE